MHVNTLGLADNRIQAEGAKYLVEMLRANFTIQHLVCRTTNLPLEGTSAFQVTFYWTLIQHAVLAFVLFSGFVQQLSAVCRS